MKLNIRSLLDKLFRKKIENPEIITFKHRVECTDDEWWDMFKAGKIRTDTQYTIKRN